MNKKVTMTQIEIAKQFNLPIKDAYCINEEKALKYIAYLKSQPGRDAEYLWALGKKTI